MEPPKADISDPGYDRLCASAISPYLTRLADEATSAGWNEAVVDLALYQLARKRFQERIEKFNTESSRQA